MPGMLTIARKWIAGGVIAAASAGAMAACKDDPECDPPSAWRDFTEVTLNVTQIGSKSTATYHALFDFAKNDLMIDVDVRDPEAGMHGIVAMVGGRVMISRGVFLERGYEIDAIDGPVLTVRLVETVLGRVLPAGPGSLTADKVAFDYAGKAGVKFATPSASGRLELPWNAKGTARKSKAGSIDFMFDLASGEKGKPGFVQTRVIGSLAMSNAPVFADAMPLDGWTIYGVGAYKTIADIRAYIAKQDKSRATDAAKKAPAKSK